MASLGFTIDGPTLDITVTFNIADADAPRILGYLMASEYGVVKENDETRTATPTEAVENYAKAMLNRLLERTVEHERNVAVSNAVTGVAPITVIV